MISWLETFFAVGPVLGLASVERSRLMPPAAILMPLVSSFGYVAAVLMVKRAAEHQVGVWRTAFVSNVAMGLCFSPLLLLGGAEVEVATFVQAMLCAALFFAGQAATFAALKGDVSLATPVMGLKIIFVAAASALLVDEPVRPAWWAAAVLATVAVALLQTEPRQKVRGGEKGAQKTGRTVALAAGAALAFALCDTLLQRFTPAWGPGRFLPIMFGLLALMSFALVPVFSAPLHCIPIAAWRWLAPGAVLLALQAASMAWTLGVHGQATVANVLYATRGLWSVLAIAMFGTWLGSGNERNLERRVFRRRLLGAGLLLAAVGLALM